ncbi:MAG: ferrochelatase [Microthrixaceae bacterium]
MARGLLVMSYGSPPDEDGIEQYYTHIRRGRPPSTEQLEDLRRRYAAIGGTSALTRRTAEQVAAITAALDADGDWIVELGTKHSDPSIEDAVGRLLGSGVDRIVGLVLAPHYSAASVGQYHGRATEALGEAAGVRYERIDSWHLLPELLAFQEATLRSTLAGLSGPSGSGAPDGLRTKVVFTAHSLPERSLVDDPYPDLLFESAGEIARRAGLAPWAGWGIGWQSAGATPEPWRGPDLLEIIDDLAATRRSDALVVVPQGFTSEHLEVLYAIDSEARAAAEAVGLELARTRVVNDDPEVMSGLARLCAETLEGPGGRR